MATPAEAVDNMLDEMEGEGFNVKRKSDRAIRSQRMLLVKQLIRFLDDVDEDLSVMEVRQALEEIT